MKMAAASRKNQEAMEIEEEKRNNDEVENKAPSSVSEVPEGVVNGEKGDVNHSDVKECDNARSKRQMKKDDSGISVEKSENSSDDDSFKKQRIVGVLHALAAASEDKSGPSDAFPKLKPKTKNRNYRKKSQSAGDGSSDDENKEEASTVQQTSGVTNPQGSSSPDSGNQESSSGLDVEMEESQDSKDASSLPEPDCDKRKRPRQADVDSDNDSDAETEREKAKSSDSEEEGDDEDEVTPSVLLKERPKHKWFVMQEVVNRQKGVSSRFQGPEMFQRRCYGSLHSVQRLELMYKLEAHHGCVNTLHFNCTGSRLASGSDDLSIVIWDWALGKMLVTYESGHRSNVFQAKFLPLTGDTHVVSCARDGQVRLAELSSTGVCRWTRRLAQHRGPAHKLAVQPDPPHVFLSAGEDAAVFNIDVREPKPEKMVIVKEGTKKVALYSIHSNPLNTNEFCVSGRDHFIRIYDKRKASENSGPFKKFCPHHLLNSSPCTHVTCAVFNYNGTEVLGSYNDEDIFLFDTRHSDGAEYIHRYEGHRNNATVKGVNFFGPKSEFVISGSDCGNIFFWEKETESIVQWMAGDENGVVNCLEAHPQLPVLATSGLDDDVKIWVPSCEHEPEMAGLKCAVISNQKGRNDDRQTGPDTFDGQMLWILWRHIRRTERRRHQQNASWTSASGCGPGERGQNGGGDGDSSSSGEDTESVDSDDAPHRVQCSPS